MTVPIYINNASLDKEAENGYLQFYLNSVSAYDGILVYSGNYDYDVTSGKTINEEFAHENRDYIVVNRNYLHFNPILTSDGRVIDESMLSDDVINVLFPEDKSERIDTYRENVRLVYSSDPNILLYDGQASEIYAYNPNISTGNGLIDQPIIVVVENHHLDGLYITSYISKGAYFIKTQTDSPYTELYPLLKASGIEAYTLELRSVADNHASYFWHSVCIFVNWSICTNHIYCKPLLRELQTQNCCLHDRRIFSDELYPGSSYPNNIRLRGQHLGPLGNRKNECYRNNGGKLNTPHSPSAGYCSYLWFVSPLFHRQSV